MVAGNLEVGQLIELREQGHGFEYTVVPPGGVGQEVLEVGPDFVVVKGDEAVAWVRYPVYLLHPKVGNPPAAAAA
jgi:hypothetical protein